MAGKKSKEFPTSCSFCGKSQEEVDKLIAGPDVFICDECVALCNEIVHEDKRLGAVQDDGTRPASLKPMQLNDHLNEYVIGQEFAKKDINAPTCKQCHGTHGILGKKNPKSVTFPTNVPSLCARCHRIGQKGVTREAPRTPEWQRPSLHDRFADEGLVKRKDLDEGQGDGR